VTESSPAPKPKRAARSKDAAPAAVAAVAAEPSHRHRHPNLGLAPVDMKAGFPVAAAALQADATTIAAAAIDAAIAADTEFRGRLDEAGRAALQHDAEALVERLAMCVASGDSRFLAEYAEWIGPNLRRRRVSQWDAAAVAKGMREVVGARLTAAESAVAGAALQAAIEVLQKNGRLGGDPHKRNALLRWFYRGV
jgi:hypothetical protein